MTIEGWGHRGHGKGRIGACLILYIHAQTGAPIYTNDPVMISKGLAKPETLKTLLYEEHCLHYLPELWRMIDSRKFKDNVFITAWWQLQRHQDIILWYDTQLRSQMDLRIRETNDYSIQCERLELLSGPEFIYTVYDPYDWSVLTKIRVTDDDLKFIDKYYTSTGKLLEIK